VDESLQFNADIKGVPKKEIALYIGFIKSALDLLPFSKMKSQHLSGGNKRKLCCALSLVGCPSLEFLDEPTTGVDPISRKSF